MNPGICRFSHRKTILGLLFLVIACLDFSCKEKENKPQTKDIVKKPELLEDRIRKNLQQSLEYAFSNKGHINDTTEIVGLALMKPLYEKNGYTAIWSANGRWSPTADSLYDFIANSKLYGLFPSDYHYRTLMGIHHQLRDDSLAKKDAALWSRTDLMMTDAFLLISEHLKRGRLPYDSLSNKKDSALAGQFYTDLLLDVLKSGNFRSALESLEPKLSAYVNLKEGIRGFLDSVHFRKYTYLYYPFTDSIAFYGTLQHRLVEEKILDTVRDDMDTTQFKKAIAKYQKKRKMKVTGLLDDEVVRALNNTDWEKYKRVALTLDKYKLMADTMPTTYVWVNLPSYYLHVVDSDSVALVSRIIVGGPKTRTPELYSEISNFVTYPQWTVPYSIIFKEMLPAIQKDTNYLKRQNLMVVDRNDSVIPPSKIKWAKLSKTHFPYHIKQMQGDDNSLGVMKFNFRNPYLVYLHDTNARWLFGKPVRALSHGCVRVQQWQDLAHFLVRNDTIKYNVDTITSWIVRQEKHVVSGFKKVPLFIRYFTCEGRDGRIKFYDDIYSEDKFIAEQYFAKSLN